MANTTVTPTTNALPVVKSLLQTPDVIKRFNETLGKKAPQFMTSLINVVAGSTELQKSDVNSIMSSAFKAAAFDLPIDQNLGFSAIVPYNSSRKDAQGNWTKVSLAQFQIMWRGFVQLAIRTGEYEEMNCSEVYEDEIIFYNPIKGKCEFVKDFTQTTQRKTGQKDKVAGYYAYFKLKSGFEKELYMSKEEIEQHALTYSQSYRSDKEKGKQTSKWTTDFDAMGRKTVIKMILSKWGILSIEMQKALESDQEVFEPDGSSTYADNQPDIVEAQDVLNQPIDTTATEIEEVDITM